MQYHIPIPTTMEAFRKVVAANPKARIERLPNGELVVTPPAGGATGRRNAKLTRMLAEWAETHDFEAFDSSTGFVLSDKSVVQPDGALVDRERWNALSEAEREDFPRLEPDVAVELVSQSDRIKPTWEKLLRMRRLGSGYVVLVDPYRRKIRTDGTPPAGFDLDFSRVFD